MNEQFSHRRYIDGDHPQVPRRREVRLLDEGEREILSAAKDLALLRVIASVMVLLLLYSTMLY